MKKVLTAIFVLMMLSGVSSAGEKWPAEVKIISDKITKVTLDYYKSLNKVKNAKDVAAAINKYASEMEKLAPQIKAIEAKYGAMGDESKNDDSEINSGEAMKDFESIQDDWSKQLSGADFSDAFMKIQQYYSDPAVMKALERLSRVMADAGISDEDEVGGNDNATESENDSVEE